MSAANINKPIIENIAEDFNMNFSEQLKEIQQHRNKILEKYDLSESIVQLVQEEGLNIVDEKIPTACYLKKYLQKADDYSTVLTNGTWYHVQSHPVFGAYT